MPRLTIPCLLLLLFCSASLAQPPRTARDAYVDGWFKETAESDLEGALALYRECAELAATSDRELAAKATLRMARIASARGDREAATLLLARLKDEFAGTQAATAAAEVVPADAPPGSDDAALAEARRLLDHLVSGRDQVIPVTHVQTILQTLGWAEAARAFAIDPVNFASFVRKVPPETLDLDGWIDLALSGPSDVRRVAVAVIRKLEPERVPARLTEEFEPTDAPLATEFLHYAIGVGTADSFAAAARVLRSVEPVVDLRLWILPLLASESVGAAEVIDAWLAKVRTYEHADSRLTDATAVEGMLDVCLTATTPAAERLRREIPTLPVKVRLRFLGRLAMPHYLEVPEPLLALCLADVEPSIRRSAILNLLRSPNAEIRRRGAAALAGEPRPVDVAQLQYAFGQEPDFVVEELLDALSGPLLEAVIHSALMNGNRSCVPILRLAHAKGDPAVAHALFLPRFWQSPELNRNRERMSFVGGAWNADRMRRDLAAESRPGLLADVVALAVSSGDAQLQFEIVRGLGSAITDRIAAGVGERLVQSESPTVLLALVESPAFHELSRDSVLALLSHPSRGVRDGAIAVCADVDLLVAIGGQADAATLETLLRRAGNLRALALKRAILARGESGGIAAVRAFAELVAVDDTALAMGLEGGAPDSDLAIAARTVIDELLHAGSTRSAVRVPEGQTLEEVRAKQDAALEKAKQEDNPVALVRGLVRGFEISASFRSALDAAFRTGASGSAEQREALLAAVRSHADDWRTAVRADRARVVVKDITTSNWSPEAGGRELAAIPARAAILSLLDTPPDGNPCRAGLWGLAALGEKDEILRFAVEDATSTAWIAPGLAAGLRGELLDLVKQGRITAEDVYRSAAEIDDLDFRADILLGERRVEDGYHGETYLRPVIDRLVERKDGDRIARAAGLYDYEYAVQSLFALERVDLVLDGVGRWPRTAADAAFVELKRRTGIPEAGFDANSWNYESVRSELVAKWRAALAK